jgi:hypothetical protein
MKETAGGESTRVKQLIRVEPFPVSTVSSLAHMIVTDKHASA